MGAESAVPRYRILLADDDPGILECYAEILGPEDDPDELAESLTALDSELFGEESPMPQDIEFDLTLCRQGEDAVAAVEKALEDRQPYSVAFLDVRMPPGLDGVRTAQRIRFLDPDINIVIVTGYSDMTAKQIARKVMPLDKFLYCQKPVQNDEIHQLATSLSAKWASEKSLTEFAGQSKKQFLANMSHELRTPLNAVIGFSELIKTEAMGPLAHDQYRQYVDDIHQCSTHLLSVINDILDQSKVEGGRFELREQRLDVGAPLRRAVDRMTQPARDSDHDLKVDIPDDLPPVLADERALEQIAVNLMSNAIKFTPNGGTITVAARGGVDGIGFSVSDTGIGIAADQIPVVLQPFRQFEAGLDRAYGGSGLGLPLSAAMVELHGGSISIDSTPGEGTVVSIDLPAGRLVPQNLAD